MLISDIADAIYGKFQELKNFNNFVDKYTCNTTHLFKVCSYPVFSIFTEEGNPLPVSFRTFSSTRRGTVYSWNPTTILALSNH